MSEVDYREAGGQSQAVVVASIGIERQQLQARERLIVTYDHNVTEPEWALGYRWDIVVRGPYATPFESRESVEPGGAKQ